MVVSCGLTDFVSQVSLLTILCKVLVVFVILAWKTSRVARGIYMKNHGGSSWNLYVRPWVAKALQGTTIEAAQDNCMKDHEGSP